MIYAQIDNEGYCFAVSMLSGEVINPDLIQLNTYDESYINRKYDRAAKAWTDEYLTV